MDFEAQRSENLKNKQRLLAELKLNSTGLRVSQTRRSKNIKSESDINDDEPTTKRRKIIRGVGNFDDLPSRTSARIASAGSRPSYREDDRLDRYNYVEPRGKNNSRTSRKSNSRPTTKLDDAEEERDQRTLIPSKDAEEIRSSWNQWTPSAAPPTRDNEDGTFHFGDYPTFMPNKSPEEVLREGCFGGSYFRPLKSRKLGILVEDDWNELPKPWVTGLDVDRYLTSPTYDADVNKFKVACGQSIEEWEAAGWIAYEHDVRGWFQWYCRFFQGRRCDDDDRQVSRWRKCVGETGRWRRMLLKKYMQLGVREVFDDGGDEDAPEVSPVMHQTCHHWAYEVRQPDLDQFWKNGGR